MKPIYRLLALLLIFTAVGGAILEYATVYVSIPITLMALALLWLSNRADKSYCYVLLVLAIFSVLELLVVTILSKTVLGQYSHFVENNAFFLTHLVIDTLVFYFILVRREVMLRVYAKNEKVWPEILTKSIVDAPMLGIFVLFIIVDILTIGENLLRHLEYFGVAESFASQFWELEFMYEYIEEIKGTLLGLVMCLLYICSFITRSQSRRMEAETT